MEDLIAASAAPLAKVLEMVDRSEAYVGNLRGATVTCRDGAPIHWQCHRRQL